MVTATHDPFDMLAEFFAPAETRRVNWRDFARPSQLPPAVWKRVWAVLGGRGGGKTFTGAHALAELIQNHPTDPLDGAPTEWGVVAPTIADARDVCIEGRSGLLRALGLSRMYSGWNRSQGQLRLPSGQMVYTGAADDGADRIQGKNLAGCWCDEIGLWAGHASRASRTSRDGRDVQTAPMWRVAWDESIQYAVRVAPAKIIATGTPKATRGARVLIRRLLDDPDVPVTVLRTIDNAANLDPAAVAEMMKLADTELGRQELDGELLDDLTGGLWKPPWIDDNRVLVGHLPPMAQTIIAVDPSGSDALDADECGLIVMGMGMDGDVYVLDDLSLRATAAEWGATAGRAAFTWRAQAIVVEDDYGKSQPEFVVRQSLRNLVRGELRLQQGAAPRVLRVSAKGRGKPERAWPVTALYQQGRVHHVDHGEQDDRLGALEEQMTTWTGADGEKSPDRVDALVHGCRFLLMPDESRDTAKQVTVGQRWGNARPR